MKSFNCSLISFVSRLVPFSLSMSLFKPSLNNLIGASISPSCHLGIGGVGMQTFVLTGVNTSLRFCWSVWLPLKIVEGEVALNCVCTAYEDDSTLSLDNDVLFMAVFVLCLAIVEDEVEDVVLLLRTDSDLSTRLFSGHLLISSTSKGIKIFYRALNM